MEGAVDSPLPGLFQATRPQMGGIREELKAFSSSPLMSSTAQIQLPASTVVPLSSDVPHSPGWEAQGDRRQVLTLWGRVQADMVRGTQNAPEPVMMQTGGALHGASAWKVQQKGSGKFLRLRPQLGQKPNSKW